MGERVSFSFLRLSCICNQEVLQWKNWNRDSRGTRRSRHNLHCAVINMNMIMIMTMDTRKRKNGRQGVDQNLQNLDSEFEKHGDVGKVLNQNQSANNSVFSDAEYMHRGRLVNKIAPHKSERSSALRLGA